MLSICWPDKVYTKGYKYEIKPSTNINVMGWGGVVSFSPHDYSDKKYIKIEDVEHRPDSKTIKFTCSIDDYASKRSAVITDGNEDIFIEYKPYSISLETAERFEDFESIENEPPCYCDTWELTVKGHNKYCRWFK